MGGMGRYACTVAVVPLGREDKKSAMMEACDDLHDADSRVLTTEMACSGIAYQGADLQARPQLQASYGPRLPRLLRQAPAQIFTCTCIRTTTVAQRLF